MPNCNSLSVITCAYSLAHHGLLSSMKDMVLRDVDLTSVPAEHLASLASCVTRIVYIENVSGCDLVTILDSVKSKELHISSQSLDSVEYVWLYGDVTLDIRVLMEYSGQEKCIGPELDNALWAKIAV